MPLMVQALLPVFILIMLGHVFRRIDFPGGDFWPQAERFTYYVLFPAMLVFKLGQARLPASAYADTALLIVAMLLAMTLGDDRMIRRCYVMGEAMETVA